jgi:putative ABC transport system permease protein
MLQVIRKNITYRPIRNGALIFCFAIIAASLFSGNYILAGASEGVTSGISKLGADIIVVPKDYVGKGEAVILRGEPSMFFFDTDVVPSIAGVQGVSQVAPQLYITTVNGTFSSVPVQLIGFNQTLDFTITPWLKKNNHVSLKKDEILVGDQITPDIDDTLKFYGHDFTIAGKLEPTGTGVDSSVFLRIEDAYTMAEESAQKSVTPLTLPEGKPSAVLIRVDNASQTHEISYRIVDKVWGVKVITPETLISTVSSQLNSLTRILYLTAIVATVLSVPLISLISILAAHERIREIGVLRALGATKGYIFRLVIGESLIIAAIGGILGIIISLVILTGLQNYIGELTKVPLLSPEPVNLLIMVIYSLLLTIIVGALASLYPAYKSAIIDPYTAIRSGEL